MWQRRRISHRTGWTVQRKLLTDDLELYDTVAEALKLVRFGCLRYFGTYYQKAPKVTELSSGKNPHAWRSMTVSGRSMR